MDEFHGLPIIERRLEDQETQVKARELLDISKAVEATHPDPHEMTEDQLEELREYAEHKDLPPRPAPQAGTLSVLMYKELQIINERLDRLEKRQLPLTESEKVELRKAMGNLRMSWPQSGLTVHKFLLRAYGEY
jgi:hypothetical protein